MVDYGSGLWAYLLVAGLFGLIFGSAINAIVWRLYVGRSWGRGRSECPDCGHKLAAKDLVPVLSWLVLRGRCRYCGKRIHWQYPAVELVTAAVFALSAWALMPTSVAGLAQLVFWLVLVVFLIILAVYDLRWMLLPDKVMLPMIGVAFAYSLAMAVLAGEPKVLVGALAAAVLGGAAFYALAFFSGGRAMGGGDVKLAFAMGLMLGLRGLAVALLLAFVVAAAVGVALMAARRKGRRDHIPFGPFLVGGTIVAFLYGQSIIFWYLQLNGLI